MHANLLSRRILATIAAATLGLVLVTATAPAADAGTGQQRSAQRTQQSVQKPRPQGDYARHTELRRTATGHTRTDTWTGERGTATRQAEVVNDRARQTRTREVRWTGPNGQQGTRTDVTRRKENGYTRNSTATGPQGGTATRDVTAVRDPASGTWTRDVVIDRNLPPGGEGG